MYRYRYSICTVYVDVYLYLYRYRYLYVYICIYICNIGDGSMINTDNIDRYYRTILFFRLTVNSIDPSVKLFSFLNDSIDHQIRFFSSEDNRSNQYLLESIDYRYRSNQCSLAIGAQCPPPAIKLCVVNGSVSYP
jgi:hypothetical protein